MRLFSSAKYKGIRNYIHSQKRYEIARTLLYFGISGILFITGFRVTGTQANLLTIVAVLGCLPASKSAVSMILFLRYKSCSEEAAKEIDLNIGNLLGLYDMVFTSYHKNFAVSHITVKGKTICGFTEDGKFSEQEFYKHIEGILLTDGYKDVTVKIFTDLNKYIKRCIQLQSLEANEADTKGILNVLKSVAL